MIEIRGLTQRYTRSRLALDHLDLDVDEGEILGLIGPNGAGKTTTIRVLATLLTPTSGTVQLAGIDVLAEPEEVRWHIGYLSDSFGVYEEMRVHQVLDFFASVYRVPAAQRDNLVADLLDLVDLRPLAREPIQNLSRGTQQRLGLARVLVHDPAVLLLDEPASGLDPRARVEIREFLKELRRLGKTVVISSHILADLADVCDRVAIVDRGKLQFHGSLTELRERCGDRSKVVVQVEGDLAKALARARSHPDVASVKEGNGKLEITLRALEAPRAAVLRHLLDGGIAVSDFHEAEADLEAAFLALTHPLDSSAGDDSAEEEAEEEAREAGAP